MKDETADSPGAGGAWPSVEGLFLSCEPSPLYVLVRMPDGTAFEGAGNSLAEAEADARARWEAWKAAGGVPKDPADRPCRVYWGTHGCGRPRGHCPQIPHACDCCTCAQHPDPDSGCVAGPPYYGPATRFYGEDAEALGLPLVAAAPAAPQDGDSDLVARLQDEAKALGRESDPGHGDRLWALVKAKATER